MFFVGLVCLYVCLHDHLQSNERISMKILPRVGLKPRNIFLNYDSDAPWNMTV